MLCKVIVCDERFALSWSRLLGGEASNSKKTGLGDWARSRARRARPSSPPPGRLQYDTEMLEGVSFSRPVRGCAAELSVSPGETKLDFFFRCAALFPRSSVLPDPYDRRRRPLPSVNKNQRI